jgi:hypothetical protein
LAAPLPGLENADWLDALRHCGICEQAHRFPYRQCDNGHIFCQTCFDRVQRCPVCRVDTATVHRNLVADAVSHAAAIPLKCKWKGCDTLGHRQGRERHEAVCPLAQVRCTECQAEGVLRDVLWHMAIVHGLPCTTWTIAGDSGAHVLTPTVLRLDTGADAMGHALLPRPDQAGTAADDPPAVLVRAVRVVDLDAVRLEFESTAWESWCIEVQLVAPGFLVAYNSAIVPLRYPLSMPPRATAETLNSAALWRGGGAPPTGPLLDGLVLRGEASVLQVRLVRT